MKSEDISIYVNALRYEAVHKALTARGQTVDQEMLNAFENIYERVVPEQERVPIEEKIREQEIIEEANRQSKRRFGVYHVRENGTDSYFTSDVFENFMQAARRFRMYKRNELNDPHESLAKAFIATDDISREQYEYYSSDRNADTRVTAVVDFDLDNDTVTNLSRDNVQKTYSLHDVSTAAYKAYRSDYKTNHQRYAIFTSALDGKEIELSRPEEPEDVPTLKM